MQAIKCCEKEKRKLLNAAGLYNYTSNTSTCSPKASREGVLIVNYMHKEFYTIL